MKDQQLQWLAEIYPELERVAQAIIQDSVTGAEDAVSNAVAQILETIVRGKHEFASKGRFAAYARKLVRGHASKYFTRYAGDIAIDPNKSHLISSLRSDRRQTGARPTEPDAGDHNPYERWEDATDPDSE